MNWADIIAKKQISDKNYVIINPNYPLCYQIDMKSLIYKFGPYDKGSILTCWMGYYRVHIKYMY